MNEPNDNQRLLSDIFAEEEDAAFRQALLGQTLSLARRRRRFRQLGKAAGALAVVACLVLLVWRPGPPKPVPSGLPPTPYTLIRTHSLPLAALVKTAPLSTGSVITSVPNAKVVTTMAAQQLYREIDDEELLALAPAPLVLVRHGPDKAEVVFANPADQEVFLRN